MSAAAPANSMPSKTKRSSSVFFGISIPHGVLYNIFSLYWIYCSTYLLALITVRYLSRTLGPAGWGMLAAVQSFGGCLLIAVEFGFTFSGTKEVARSRNDPGTLKKLISAVQGAKILLAVLSCGAALAVQQASPIFRNNPGTFWWGIAWGVAQGANLMWFFQGIERMRLVATLDFAARAIAVAATFVLVQGPADAWRALALQAAASFLSFLFSFGLAWKITGFEIPKLSAVMDALRNGVRTFIPRNASGLYTVGSTFLLGFFARPEIVGFYAGADRISRALVGLLAPASEAVFPRISHVATQSRDRTLRLARLSAAIMATVGAAMAGAQYLLAPLLVHMLLGPGYDAAVLPLRILSVLPPLIALRNVLAIHWMLPLDLERELNAVVVACGVLNVILAIVVAPHYGGVGMAWVVVGTQAFASLGAWLVLKWLKLDPFGSSSGGAAAVRGVPPIQAAPFAK